MKIGEKHLPAEAVFSLAICAIGVVFFWQGQVTRVDEMGVNARTMPSVISIILIVYGAFSAIWFLKQNVASAHEGIENSLHKVFWTAVLPLLVEMALYVFLIRLIGYPLATFLIMPSVFWTFGLRSICTILALSAVSSLIGWIIFIQLLGMYVPPGSFWEAPTAVLSDLSSRF